YSPLSQATLIRLLEVHPSPPGEIYCSLTIADLDDNPIFDALSYTWGNPITLHDKPEPRSPLEELQDLALEVELGNREEIVSGTSRSKYIWIGAICINQEDIEERHAQVSVMRRIYGQASCVLGWFGKEDRTSRRAFRTLHKLLLHSFTQWQPNQAFFLWTFGDINEADWMALFALLQRLWFRRIWIVQEAVFAQRLIIVCGGVMIHWFGVQKCLKFLKETQLDENLGNFAKALIYGGPSNRYIQKLQLAGVALWGISHKQHALPAKLLANPRDPFTFIAGIQYIRDSFEARISEVKACRRMFTTEKGYIGMGTYSIQTGDQIWILKGANVPMVRRKWERENFILVGEAYVHGVMHGEALEGDE
ncbi:hypothetical protein N431DRAFT_299754, partial [Stipitochalara longipes BDJ]